MLEILLIAGVVVGVIAWRKSRRASSSGPPAPYGVSAGSYTRQPSLGEQVPPGKAQGPPRIQLSGHMQELSAQALSEIDTVLGPSHNPREQETYQEVADFLAAMRYYRTAVAAAFSDDLIEGGLGDPAPFIRGFIARYEESPVSPDRDQAIAVLRRLDSMYGNGVIVAMGRLVISKLRSLGY